MRNGIVNESTKRRSTFMISFVVTQQNGSTVILATVTTVTTSDNSHLNQSHWSDDEHRYIDEQFNFSDGKGTPIKIFIPTQSALSKTDTH
jgi:uncharacterized lipoprotein NlpE involved in copper resistance